MVIQSEAIAFVKNSRRAPEDDHWAPFISEIRLAAHIPTEAFDGIEAFSQLEIIYHFDQANADSILFSGRPRGNPDYPLVGIFAQRKKDRPNRIGLTRVELLSHEGRVITVRFLDAIDGTPVLDIKPVFREFQTNTEIRQPDWVGDLMKHYWE